VSHGLKQTFAQFFGVAIHPQTYLNLIYLTLAFPLGLFYFILLVMGFSLFFPADRLDRCVHPGWMFVIWEACAAFERAMAIGLLHEDIPPMMPRCWRARCLGTG
jgi:hypothetical protein